MRGTAYPSAPWLERENAQPDQVQLWQRIVKEATRQLGASRDFQWHAVIGEHPEAFTSPPQVLSGTRRVGTIDLQPSGNAFMELTGPLAAFGTGQIARTFLVRVSGTASGYDLEAAKLAAEYDLNLLCSLLALVSGRLWISRWPLTMDPQASLGFPITPPGQDNVAEGGPYPAPPKWWRSTAGSRKRGRPSRPIADSPT
nr:hypothetical protein GCM10020092_005260 [Actinoplanes digitatis]